MNQYIPKKAPPLLLAIFYFTAITLATFCSFTGLTGHSHQHSKGVAHSSTCLLACATAVAQTSGVPFSPCSLFFFGALFLFGALFSFQSSFHLLPSRAPPRI